MNTLLETAITNINFVFLFLIMLLYWLKSALFLNKKDSFLPDRLLQVSGIFQTTFLILRWNVSHHFPLSNLYESLLFLSWSLTIGLILLNKQLISSNLNANQENKRSNTFSLNLFDDNRLFYSMFGSILTPLILLVNTFATLGLPEDLKTTSALVPALQSNWLVMHVSVMMLSYAALLCGCLFSIAYLILNFILNDRLPVKTFLFNKMKKQALSPFVQMSVEKTLAFDEANPILVDFEQPESFQPLILTQKQNNAPLKKQNTEKRFYELKTFDNLSYRLLGLGFPLLTIGILSGAVWANQTWGSYWSWDPKETWALITWFVFAIYLHTRLSKGWNGSKSAWLASFGFFIIWICYLGVNLMGKGLHSYGFFT